MFLKNPQMAFHGPKSEVFVTVHKALSDLAADFLLCLSINSRLQLHWPFASFLNVWKTFSS